MYFFSQNKQKTFAPYLHFVHLHSVLIAEGMKVFIHAAAATPMPLVESMAKWGKKSKLKDVEVIHIHIEGKVPHVEPECEGIVNFPGSTVYYYSVLLCIILTIEYSNIQSKIS